MARLCDSRQDSFEQLIPLTFLEITDFFHYGEIPQNRFEETVLGKQWLGKRSNSNKRKKGTTEGASPRCVRKESIQFKA